jgi:molybdate transport system substrate-binding protein
MSRRLPRLAVAALLALSACGREEPERPAVTVLAASSLTDALSAVASAFEAAEPGIDVRLSFAGSQALATQIRHGLAADVFASADPRHADALLRDGLAEPARAFASNGLVLALPVDAAGPTDLESLADVGSLVLGDREVPAGRYADALLAASARRFGPAWGAAVQARIVSREPNVRLAAAKVAMGEADAALVYATDVAAAGRLRAVPLPPDLSPATSCVHARLRSAPEPLLAERWMAFVESAPGQALLAAKGFGAPAP